MNLLELEIKEINQLIIKNNVKRQNIVNDKIDKIDIIDLINENKKFLMSYRDLLESILKNKINKDINCEDCKYKYDCNQLQCSLSDKEKKEFYK